jgi:hypothetical protein
MKEGNGSTIGLVVVGDGLILVRHGLEGCGVVDASRPMPALGHYLYYIKGLGS